MALGCLIVTYVLCLLTLGSGEAWMGMLTQGRLKVRAGGQEGLALEGLGRLLPLLPQEDPVRGPRAGQWRVGGEGWVS